MKNVLFTRKDESEISNVPIIDGQILFDTSGSGKMYLDNGTVRMEMGGARTVDAVLDKTSINPIQNKAVASVMLDKMSDINKVQNSGFLTDALATKELSSIIDKTSSSLVASDGTQFRFGKNDDGEYGYIIQDESGADSVIPFKKSSITLIGTYSGNQTIDVSEYVNNDTTADNFLFDNISGGSTAKSVNSGDSQSNSATAWVTGCSLKKTYDSDKKTLTISGAYTTLLLTNGYTGNQQSIGNASYTIYMV
jgi:hypothetical protein